MSTAPARTCGSCSLCCKVLKIEELQKPMGAWCPNFKAGSGCSVYGAHPPSCQTFQCLWLISPTMPDSARPDRCKVVLTIDDGGRRIIARADPAHPGAWRQQPLYGQLKHWAAEGWSKGRTIWAMVGRRMWLVAPGQDVDVGETDERSPLAYEQRPDGTIKVTVLPPLPEGEDYDPAAVNVAMGWPPAR